MYMSPKILLYLHVMHIIIVVVYASKLNYICDTSPQGFHFIFSGTLHLDILSVHINTTHAQGRTFLPLPVCAVSYICRAAAYTPLRKAALNVTLSKYQCSPVGL